MISNDTLFRVVMNGTAVQIYSDPLLSTLSPKATLFTGIHCLNDGSVLILSEPFVMHIAYTSSSPSVTLFNQSIPASQDDWFSWKLTANESRLLVSVRRYIHDESSSAYQLFLYDLSSLTLVNNVTLDAGKHSAFTSCLFLMDDGVTFGSALIRTYNRNATEQSEECRFEILLFDSQDLTNSTLYPTSQLNGIPSFCDNYAAGALSCLQFPELHTVMLYISLDYKYAPDVYTYYTFTSVSPSLWNSSMSEINVTLDFGLPDFGGLVAGWITPHQVQVFGCEIAIESLICHLFEYDVLPDGSAAPNKFVQTSDYPIASSPYSFAASISTASDMAYLVSVQPIDLLVRNLSYNIDVMRVNLSKSYTPTTPKVSITFRLPVCECIDPSLLSEVVLFELQLDGTLVLWTSCFAVFVLDSNTLQLLETHWMEPEDALDTCSHGSGATDRNGTMYLLSSGVTWDQELVLSTYTYRSSGTPTQAMIFNQTALGFPIPQAVSVAVVNSSVFVLSENVSAQLDAETLAELQIVEQPEWTLDQLLSLSVVTPNDSFIYTIGISWNATEPGYSLLEIVSSADLNTTSYSVVTFSATLMPGYASILFSTYDTSAAYLLLGTGVLHKVSVLSPFLRILCWS